MTHGAPPDRAAGGPRTPAAVYGGLTVALLALVATLAFTARQAPPPQVAEVTPQAQHQISKAPAQQSAAIGAGQGRAGAPGEATTTTAGPRGPGTPAGAAGSGEPLTAAVHHCYGDPPMQVAFDTQSPPCVAYWAGDNGGSTSMGVTGDEVRVGMNPGGTVGARVETDLFNFFNRYFELYGRKLVPVGEVEQGSGCAGRKADADGTVSEYRPFAAEDQAGSSSDTCYLTELARDKVVSTTYQPLFSSSEMAQYSPYLYQYDMALDGQFADVGRFVCRQLAGRPARFSPDPTTASKQRKFGLIIEYDADPVEAPDYSPLSEQLARCGTSLAAVWTDQSASRYASGGPANSNTQDQEAILKMKQAGVTTVLLFGQIFAENGIAEAATEEDYHPEWCLCYGNDFDEYVNLFWNNPDQRLSTFGMTWMPRQVPYPYTTLDQALAMVDPGYSVTNVVDYVQDQELYWMLLEIASGVQLAGPDLTPYTFQRGLQDAHFPNPFSIEEEGSAGFPGGAHAMTDDFALMWWSQSAPSPYPDQGSGTWCYVDGGRRYTLGDLPPGPTQLFSGPCNPGLA